MHNQTARDAKRIIRELRHILAHVDARYLPKIAKELGNEYRMPKPAMLRAMARYARLSHQK